LKEEEMAERIGPYGSNPYGSVPHLWSAPLVQTEAEKALKMVDPLGWHFPSAEDKARFCAFFDISGVDVGNEFQVHQFCRMYRDYLFPKPEGISYDQREMLQARGRDDQTLLARAIQLNPSLIPDLVACGADVNQPCTGLNFAGGRMTPLFLAAQSGHTESIPALVRAGANINEVRPDTGETPLIRAASQEHTCIAAFTLIDNGARVDWRDRQGRSALQYAIAFNDRDLVSLLIEKRAPFDSACYNQLLMAPDLLQYVKEKHPNLIALIVNRGDPALIPELVNQGFDIEARGPDGYTARPLLKEGKMEHFGEYRKAPPGYAAMTLRPDGTYGPGQTEAQKALKIVDPYGHLFPTKEDQTRFMDFFDIFGMDAEHEAAVQHFFGCCCAYLVPQGGVISEAQRKFVNTDVNTGRNADPGPKTPLARAWWLEKYDRFLDLLACGADLRASVVDVNRRVMSEKFGPITLPFLAAELDHSESIPALVRAGADLNQVENLTGETPLTRAARLNRSGAAKTLVRCGARVDCRDLSGRSALLHAIGWNDRDLVSLLIEKRAPFDWACYDQLVQAPELLAYLRKEHPNLIALIVSGSPALVPALVNQSFDIEARGPDGYTALERAVGKGDQALVKDLLSLEAKINAETLMIAVQKGDLSMITLLENNGADFGLLNESYHRIYQRLVSGQKY
jgi:ankyrin repeat protein